MTIIQYHFGGKALSVCGVIAAFSIFVGCQEQRAGGDGDAGLESKVRAAEIALEEMRDELEAYRASGGASSLDSQEAELQSVEQEVQVLKLEVSNLKQEFQDFKRSHPMPQ